MANSRLTVNQNFIGGNRLWTFKSVFLKTVFFKLLTTILRNLFLWIFLKDDIIIIYIKLVGLNEYTHRSHKKNCFIHFFYIKTSGKRDSSKSRYVCAVDEILDTDHLKKIQIVLDSVSQWLERKPQFWIYMHK